jgi:energy-coupling factor transporter ATP-binding protein EcfA2
MEGIDKSFPGVRALDQARFELRAGEIHALVGENGAGKSTLMKVLAGVVRCDAGVIRLGDERDLDPVWPPQIQPEPCHADQGGAGPRRQMHGAAAVPIGPNAPAHNAGSTGQQEISLGQARSRLHRHAAAHAAGGEFLRELVAEESRSSTVIWSEIQSISASW